MIALVSIMAVAMAATPFLNNAATVLIVAPVGASLAGKLGLNPDPFLMAVAVGALTLRTEFCRELLALQPAAVRGNASEIMALAGMSGGGRGVDTTDTAAAALPAAQALARQLNTVVAVTGEVDYVTDGQRTRAVTGGDPLMTRVVGTGCALSAVVAAAAAMPGDRLENVAAACGLMKLAGGKAALQGGPGSFTPAFLDALYAGGDL